jgi:hypothetical protein
MPMNAAKYTAEQRDAMAHAFEDRGIRPASRVVALAAEGKLTVDGRRVDAFDCNENTVRDEASKLRRRRAGDRRSKLIAETPRDSVEALRRQLVSLTDRELAALKRRKAGTVSGEQLRQIARAVRELAAIPGPDDPRPVAPGARTPGTGERESQRTTGGLAGQVLAAHSRTAGPGRVETGETAAQDGLQRQGDERDTGAQRSTHDTGEQSGVEAGAPGAWARAQGEAVMGT